MVQSLDSKISKQALVPTASRKGNMVHGLLLGGRSRVRRLETVYYVWKKMQGLASDDRAYKKCKVSLPV